MTLPVSPTKASRVIMVHNQSILLIKRDKHGHIYYTLPGGGIDDGETADQAARRELKEETSLEIGLPRLVYIEDPGEPYAKQHIFVADYMGGDMHLQADSIESQLNAMGGNTYTPMWVPVSKFASLPFRSHVLQQQILKGLREGWPREPELLKSQAEISHKEEEK